MAAGPGPGGIGRILAETGVLMEGHFRLTSGRHSPSFLQCARLLQYPQRAEQVCRAMAEAFAGSGVEVVVGPAFGGVVLAYEVARILGARSIYAEREGGRMSLRRGFSVVAGERALVVEDAVTTGGSVREVLDLVRICRGEPVGVAAIVDRSGGTVVLGVPFRALLTVDIPSYAPADCPLCREGVPLSLPKSGAPDGAGPG